LSFPLVSLSLVSLLLCVCVCVCVSVCQVDDKGACADNVFSPLRFFYPNGSDTGCGLVSEAEAAAGFKVMLTQAEGIGGFFMSGTAVGSKYSNKTRANLLLGSPLSGFQDADDDKDMQGDLYRLFFSGLDCKTFTKDLEGKLKRYKGTNPCREKPQAFFFEGVESLLLKKFHIQVSPLLPVTLSISRFALSCL
jgi:hypothetical protein